MTDETRNTSHSARALLETAMGRGDAATKLEALRAAAQCGVSAFDRGEFKEFPDAAALVAYLNTID
jgi:hypothetical protein